MTLIKDKTHDTRLSLPEFLCIMMHPYTYYLTILHGNRSKGPCRECCWFLELVKVKYFVIVEVFAKISFAKEKVQVARGSPKNIANAVVKIGHAKEKTQFVKVSKLYFGTAHTNLYTINITINMN